ncbi:MAG: RnfABCDGE type electron transport complex subunit D [Gammaproteobacteria bacterium]|nr:RnfABCDGE type electron transport complex subunit D [Gammaproteobacteria bacterium]
MRFETAAAPHLPVQASVPRLMRRVLWALAPAAAAHLWFFGPGLAFNLIVAVVTALAAEALMLRLRGRPLGPGLADGSAVLAAVLLAFALPPLTPWWITATGSAFAMIVAKHLYGGLGYNVFNPAMAGYAVVLVSFPGQLALWSVAAPGGLAPPALDVGQTLAFTLTGRLPDTVTLDAITQATPLDAMRSGLAQLQTLSEIRTAAPFGGPGEQAWLWINGLIALGGLWLLWTRAIRWHIPVAMLATLALLSAVAAAIDGDRFPGPFLQLFSGAALIGAFFIATDPVSAATTRLGRLIYGSGIGALVFAIRSWGGYPDGVAFAVLLMNLAVPLLDRHTRSRPFGA